MFRLRVRSLMILMGLLLMACLHAAAQYDPAKILNAWKNRQPGLTLVGSHRGEVNGPRYQNAPENSIAAFQNAVDLGNEIIEMDVYTTYNDHVPYLMHDKSLLRMMGLQLSSSFGFPNNANFPNISWGDISGKTLCQARGFTSTAAGGSGQCIASDQTVPLLADMLAYASTAKNQTGQPWGGILSLDIRDPDGFVRAWTTLVSGYVNMAPQVVFKFNPSALTDVGFPSPFDLAGLLATSPYYNGDTNAALHDMAMYMNFQSVYVANLAIEQEGATNDDEWAIHDWTNWQNTAGYFRNLLSPEVGVKGDQEFIDEEKDALFPLVAGGANYNTVGIYSTFFDCVNASGPKYLPNVPNGATGLNGYWANGSDPNVGGVCSSLAATDEESLDKIDHRYDFNFVTGRTSSNTPEIENPPNFGMILADTSQQVLSYLEGIGQRSNLYAIQASPCGGTNPAPGCDGNGQTNMTFCAYEGGTCTFAGDRNVTFTANGVYLTKTFTNTAACNLQTFGSDPAPGLQKSCYYSPAIVYAPNSIYCGDEYQRCNYSTENIYAGMAANQHFYWGPFYPTGSSNSYACSLAYFGGDVAPGFQKACFYQAQQQYFIPHTGPGGYAFCAGAGDGTLTTSQCTFEGPQRVAYGANGQFTYRVFNDSVPCNNASFGGDPAPGSTKDCWVEMISGTNGVTGTQVGPDPASTSTPGTGDGSGGTSTPGTGGGGGFDPRLPQMQSVPQAIWVTGAANDAATVGQALTNYALSNQLLGRGGASTLAGGAQGSVPVFALYNIPGRDCGSYSAGGAQDSAAYTAWIDGITGAIGGNQAVILLEPDSLAHIPSDCGYDPNPVNIAQATADRFAQIAYAVQAFKNRTPNVALYLDGGNSHWLAVPEMAQRLVQAGVQNAAGFYSNVSNYIASDREAHYDYWVSQCIAFGQDPEENGWRLGNYSYCASQYDAQLNVATPGTGGTSTPGTGDGGGGTTTPVLYPINPDDMSTWGPTDAWFSQNMGTAVPTVHYVIDTSRNGQDRYDSSVEANAPYYQPASVLTANDTGSWCNPPGRGLGVLPTIVGNGLLDAYFWVKTVGQSDGNCDAAGATRGWDYSVYTQSTSTPGTSAWPTDPSQQALFDPLWSMFDPQAGQYFPQQAFALVNKANPQFSTSGIPGLPNGTYTITNVNSGLVMDVTGGYSTNGTLIDQWSSNGQLNQEWQITNMGNNLYQLVAMNSGSCLDGWESSPQNGGALDEWSCYGGANQLYSITRTNMATYTITNSMTGLVVEVPNSSTQLGTTLDQWQFNGSTNQQWTFTKLN